MGNLHSDDECLVQTDVVQIEIIVEEPRIEDRNDQLASPDALCTCRKEKKNDIIITCSNVAFL